MLKSAHGEALLLALMDILMIQSALLLSVFKPLIRERKEAQVKLHVAEP